MNDSNDSKFKIQNIQTKLDSLETQMNRIETKLDKLLKDFEILNELEPQCKKMSEHIDFVENVYDIVRTPFSYILGTYSSNSQNKLINCTKNEKTCDLKTITNNNNYNNHNNQS